MMITKLQELKEIREELRKLVMEYKKKIIRGEQFSFEDIKKLDELV